MELVCFGLNHRSAPVEVRERFAVPPVRLGEKARELLEAEGIDESVVLSTCNRTEFYLAGDSGDAVVAALRESIELGGDDCWYEMRRMEAAKHLCRVAGGLDSMVLGETEIFGQVKDAYRRAHAAGATSGVLNRLFQRAFGVGKKIRTETTIQEGATSVAGTAVELAEKIFGKLKGCRVIVIGAGEMSRQTAKALVSRGASTVFVTNRSFERAEELADEMGGRAVRYDDWQATLAGVDVVISSTSAPHAVVKPFHVEAVRRVRKFRPLFLIDIAVPRDVDPEVAEIEEVYLYDIDTLEQLASEARGRRERQIDECGRIIDEELEKLNLPGT